MRARSGPAKTCLDLTNLAAEKLRAIWPAGRVIHALPVKPNRNPYTVPAKADRLDFWCDIAAKAP